MIEANEHIDDTGLMALVAVAMNLGFETSTASLGREVGSIGRKATSGELLRAAQSIGMGAELMRHQTIRSLERVRQSAILKLTSGEFVVFRRRSDDIIVLYDPRARQSRIVTLEEVRSSWAGEMLLFSMHETEDADEGNPGGWGWMMAAIWRYRDPIYLALIASVFCQLFALATPLLFQVIVDKVLAHNSLSTLYVVVFAMTVISVFDVIMQYLRSYTLAHTASQIDALIGSQFIGKLLSLPLAFFERRSVGQIASQAREIENIRSFLTGSAVASLIDAAFTVILIVALLFYSISLTAVVAILILVNIGVVTVFRPILRQLAKERYFLGARYQQLLIETISGIPTIKSASVEPFFKRDLDHRLEDYVRSSFAVNRTGQLGQNIISLSSKFSVALVLLFGVQDVVSGLMTVGGLIAFNMISSQTMAPVLRLSNVWQDYQQFQISVDRMGDVFRTESESSPSYSTGHIFSSGSIALRNVSFQHVADGPYVLRNICLEIKPGEVIGIIGPSGSGKSTLAKLLQKLYIPSSGQILVDGIDLQEIMPSEVRRQIGVVLQDNLLFNRSIHDNISIGQSQLTRIDVVGFAKLAGADQFIRSLPRGYDTLIEERGMNLSGGQRQRIAIARALAAAPQVLIFDEATSALDYESERAIQSNMTEIVSGRTVIIIAHRLAAVRDCDRIIGMEDGEIVEVGSHDELLGRAGGLYARLWALQGNTRRSSLQDA